MKKSIILENRKELNLRRKNTLLIQNHSNTKNNMILIFKKISREKLVSKYKKTIDEINKEKINQILTRKKCRLVSLYFELLFRCDPSEFLVKYIQNFKSRIKIKQMSKIHAFSVKLFPCYSKYNKSYQLIISKYLLLKQSLIDLHENLKNKRLQPDISFNTLLNTKFYESLEKSSHDKSKEKINYSSSKAHTKYQHEESYQSIKNLIKKIDTCENDGSFTGENINLPSSPTNNENDIVTNFLITATKTVNRTYTSQDSVQNFSDLLIEKNIQNKKFKENSHFIEKFNKMKLEKRIRSEIIFDIQKEIRKEEYALKKFYKKKIPEKINKLALVSTSLSEINSTINTKTLNRIVHCDIGESYNKFLFLKNEEKIKKINKYKTISAEKPFKLNEILKTLDIQKKRNIIKLPFK